MGEVKNIFRPEFLNRVDEIIVFHALEQPEIDAIAQLLRLGVSVDKLFEVTAITPFFLESVKKITETDSSDTAGTWENCLTLYTCVQDQSAYRWCVRAVETFT